MRTARSLLILLIVLALCVPAFAQTTKYAKVVIGTGTGLPTSGLLNLKSGTTAASGIYFGSDVTLYRSAANVLKTDDSLTVTGTLTAGAIAYTTLETTGNTTLGDAGADAISVLGTATFTPLATFTGGATSTGTLTANGNVVLGDTVADTVTVNGTPTFKEAVVCEKTLGVTGVTTLGTAAITTLGVSGVTTLTGALVANGAVTLGDASGDAITVNGTPTFAQDATFTNQIIANGNVTLGNASTDTITCTGRLIVRIVTDAGPMTATNGTQGEIVFETSTAELYICTVTGTPATWKACT